MIAPCVSCVSDEILMEWRSNCEVNLVFVLEVASMTSNSSILRHNQALFGGAISMSVPMGWTDVSTIRQVPDSQEVFMHPENKCTLILEVLAPVDAENQAQCIK